MCRFFVGVTEVEDEAPPNVHVLLLLIMTIDIFCMGSPLSIMIIYILYAEDSNPFTTISVDFCSKKSKLQLEEGKMSCIHFNFFSDYCHEEGLLAKQFGISYVEGKTKRERFVSKEECIT